jgi:uncharacterized protein (DUF433 family)
MTTQTDTSPAFSGIYGIPEVAHYLVVSPPLVNGHPVPITTLRYWIRTNIPHVATSPYPTRQRLVTFLDLISMRMVAILRSRGVRLPEIRNTETYLRKDFGLDYPFAMQSLWTYGSHVFISFEEHLLVASRFGQEAMNFIKTWLREVKLDMTFDDKEFVSSWTPYKGIRFDPKIQFGAPCIEGTRIPTSAIWSNTKAGDSLETLASLYEVNPSQIKSAVEWEERLDANRSRHILRN